jgi:argininosuccinate lyase
MQRAMPSSLQLLTGSYIESLIDDMELLRTAYLINNSSPLGSAAGYGTSLGLDRSYTSALLGFRKSRNCIYVQARGKHMATLLIPLSSVMKTLERIAADLLLFTMGEFAFFTLPERFCTGSSIMPQKKNYDLLELVRARASMVHSHEIAVSMISGKLISGYNRDLQMTKAPLMEAFSMTGDSVEIMSMVFHFIEVDVQKMKDAITPEFFATDRAYDLVKEGMPFRDAYARVARDLHALKVPDDILAGREFLGFHDYEPEIEEARCRFSDIKASPALYL